PGRGADDHVGMDAPFEEGVEHADLGAAVVPAAGEHEGGLRGRVGPPVRLEDQRHDCHPALAIEPLVHYRSDHSEARGLTLRIIRYGGGRSLSCRLHSRQLAANTGLVKTLTYTPRCL